mmetsp:Transcript_9187/g.13594  ORF Transcript_9187/g.13594 Transcript_9187/m.13594 type:complete len:318 (+) Transcript_9187:31-984(+)
MGFIGCTLEIVGAIALLCVAFKVAGLVIRHLLSSPGAAIRKLINKNKWAMVTGVTGGIGKGFAEDIAKRGGNVVLVARNEQKLNQLANDLKKDYGVQTRIVVIDFNESPENLEKAYDNLKKSISDISISVLINNVGVNTYLPDKYLDMKASDVNWMVHVNINSLLNVSRVVMERMVEQPDQKHLIVNLSSYTAKAPCPHMAVYSATKAFIAAFSSALRYEYPNIDVRTITPMYVASAMTNISEEKAKKRMDVCTPRQLAQQTFAQVGSMFTQTVFNPYWHHDLMTTVITLLPEWFVASKATQQMKHVKKRLLAKQQQ